MPPTKRVKARKKQVRRAKQARSKATVEAIIEATTRILARDGWASVNTNAIAERAGVSVGSVYEYFPDKQAILDIVVDTHLTRAETLIREGANLAARNIEPAELVQLLVAGFMEIHEDDPALHRALATELPLSKTQQNRIDGLRAEIIAVVTKALHDRVDQPRLKATLVVDTADAIAHRWVIDEVGVPVDSTLMRRELERMLGLYLTA